MNTEQNDLQRGRTEPWPHFAPPLHGLGCVDLAGDRCQAMHTFHLNTRIPTARLGQLTRAGEDPTAGLPDVLCLSE
jgi:hypothetical protein